MGNFRLRTKREIDVAKAQDRQREIDEGTKLAKRVDTLRNTLPQEEKKLDEFRVNALTKIQSEIDPKVKELESINTQIRDRKTELEVLMQPLDEKLNLLDDKEELLREREEYIIQNEALIKTSIAANIRRERDNEMEKSRISDDRKMVSDLLSETKEMNRAAASNLMDARIKSKSIIDKANMIEESMLQREKDVISKEMYEEERRKQNDIDYKNNLDERIRIRDTWATLERNKKRLYG